MKTHVLKIQPEYLEAIIKGVKTFEIRKNDRDFKVGEYAHLYDAERYVSVRIKYITDFAQQEGYVVFAFDLIEGGQL
ncbi:DUF3850 domain-containing protein [Photobacterium chitinilyticum]|uniref:DUF3850 domain-containing protein n=1 Tax=Photobacterium chitinilyticum TaxID=2485123 RepID=A0A3S3SYG5_9GAMM|nr:DUF3850 domain-containing protein [Photobacterium chitinilyticum]RWX54972.1 DUF3850 domain-containing protein [Photobacterium chitinilyticum]